MKIDLDKQVFGRCATESHVHKAGMTIGELYYGLFAAVELRNGSDEQEAHRVARAVLAELEQANGD